ncbi:MAG: PorV/PorQ family protein, partial [Ignavibacteria bacterium]|nr:PorV/PorQ family protein [Ignavibacteria bacterium]
GLYPLGYKDNGKVGNVGAYTFGVAYAKAISTQFAIGGNVKLAAQNLGENLDVVGSAKQNNAAKLVFDAGVKYKTGFKSFAFGMSIRNFASNIKREEISEQLPLTFTLGAAMDIYDIIEPGHTDETALNVAIDFLHQNNYSERVNLGAEYKLMKMIFLRAGYQTNRDLASWSGGVGVNTSISEYDIQFNYSYSRYEIFDSVNRISVNLNF